MSELRAGTQLASVVCETRVVVVRADDPTVLLTCGGEPMVPVDRAADPAGEVAAGHVGPTAVGKRYVNEDGTLEVLCSRAGAGALAVGGVLLTAKDAKPLPSSD